MLLPETFVLLYFWISWQQVRINSTDRFRIRSLYVPHPLQSTFCLWFYLNIFTVVLTTPTKACIKAPHCIIGIHCTVQYPYPIMISLVKHTTIMYLYPLNCHHWPNNANVCLSCSCHFLSADAFLLGSPHVKQVSGVVLKVELAPCFFYDWHLCQSIHSRCNSLQWEPLSRQIPPESVASDKHGCLASHQTNTRVRSRPVCPQITAL